MKTTRVAGKINDHRVLVYALSTCVWCKQNKRFLEDKGVEYEYVDVDLCSEEDSEEIHKRILGMGGRFVFPTVIVDEKVLINGYHEDQLRKALGL